MNTQTVRKLVGEAAVAARNAYAPHSKFRVGAALLTAKGMVFRGCNMENASYGLTICAERAAFAAAIATGERKFKALAIVAADAKAAYPCGACLQVMAEFCGPDFPIWLGGKGNLKKATACRLKDLLPKAFRFKKRA